MNNGAIIHIRDLRKVYHTGKVSVEALRGVNLEVPKGEFLSVVGPSGSGKSTLFHIVGGLTPPTSGEVIVGGLNVGHVSDAKRTELRRTQVAFVFQKFNLLPNLSARDNIRTALHIAGRPMDHFEKELHDVLELLAIARALATKPAILLADEPTGNLDSANSLAVLNLLRDLNKRLGQTILMITHNAEAADFGDRIVHMRDGRIVEAPAAA